MSLDLYIIRKTTPILNDKGQLTYSATELGNLYNCHTIYNELFNLSGQQFGNCTDFIFDGHYLIETLPKLKEENNTYEHNKLKKLIEDNNISDDDILQAHVWY